jgi:hypothetical protein
MIWNERIVDLLYFYVEFLFNLDVIECHEELNDVYAVVLMAKYI